MTTLEILEDESRPIWIVVHCFDDPTNVIFEGHQGHWADCFYSNATRSNIKNDLSIGTVTITRMTDEHLAMWPEAVSCAADILKEYGEP